MNYIIVIAVKIGSEFIIKIPDVFIKDLENDSWINKVYNNREERINMELSDIYE